MSLLSQRLQLKVAQKQILTPGLVQMVTVLQMTRLELKDLIAQEIAENPVLEETADGGEELTAEELQPLLEAERDPNPSDQSFLDMAGSAERSAVEDYADDATAGQASPGSTSNDPLPEPEKAADPFDEIDFGSYFEDYLDPGFKSPAQEASDKPSFELFLSAPIHLADHLEQQLSLVALSGPVREASNSIIGNLDENGYLTEPLEEISAASGFTMPVVEEALSEVQKLDPAGVGARNLQECLLLQLDHRNARGGVAWQIVEKHLRLLELRQHRELAKLLDRPIEHIQIALRAIQRLDPRPGLRYNSAGARHIEPDVYITKDGDDYLISLNDDEIPQLRLNPQYKRLLDRENEKDVRNYVKERFQSALLLMKNIEQRKRTIVQVCQSVIARQREFLDKGIDRLKPMMIKDVAEEIGVHPSTVSRAVAGKFAHTPQGVFELRYFFSEAVQGTAGSDTPLLVVKRKVKKMIDDENSHQPLTDDQITSRLRQEGIDVTRRTVAKYREDMKIPSTHQRRQRA